MSQQSLPPTHPHPQPHRQEQVRALGNHETVREWVGRAQRTQELLGSTT